MLEAHARSVDELLDQLGVAPDTGLDEAEAARRRREHGANGLEESSRRSAWSILSEQAKSLIFALLLVAAALSFGFGESVQGIAILIALVINVAIGFATELQARRSMEALKSLERVEARVRRACKILEDSLPARTALEVGALCCLCGALRARLTRAARACSGSAAACAGAC